MPPDTTPRVPKAPRLTAQRSARTPRKGSEAQAARLADYYLENREALLKKAKRRYDDSDAFEKAIRRFRIAATPPMPRPGSTRGTVHRNIAMARAFCSWSDVEEVVRIYLACGVMNDLGLGHYVVDHSIPLTNPFVSGLHVHHNLRVITAAQNKVKSNYLWPQMPTYDWGTIDLLTASL